MKGMDFYVMAKSYNSYGGHLPLALIGDFLLQGAPDFGDAIKEIDVTLCFRDEGPAAPTLGDLLVRHNNYRATLPKVTYYRARGKVELGIASEIEAVRDWHRNRGPSLPLFTRGVEEVIQALPLIGRRLKKGDAFDLKAFLAHCDGARMRIPATEAAMQELAGELQAADAARCAAMSPWEKLGIEWEDYHPQAREMLDDPFFWDCVDDFAPHGNDTGADLLESYRAWLKSHRDGQPARFLLRFAQECGYADVEAMDAETRDESVVALAFADMKLRGVRDAEVRTLALEGIGRQRAQAVAETGWTHRESRLEALAKLEQMLKG